MSNLFTLMLSWEAEPLIVMRKLPLGEGLKTRFPADISAIIALMSSEAKVLSMFTLKLPSVGVMPSGWFDVGPELF